MQVFVIIVAFVALISVGIYFSYKLEKKRTEEFAALANELGLSFAADGASEILSQLSGLRLFNRGHSRRFKNMMYGVTNDVDMAIFGYRFTTGSGKHQSTVRQSVISFRSDSLQLPDSNCVPKGCFTGLGRLSATKISISRLTPSFRMLTC